MITVHDTTPNFKNNLEKKGTYRTGGFGQGERRRISKNLLNIF